MRHYSAYYKSKLGYEYILDTVPGASLALSLRKLRSAYAGYCIRIRRSSDNAELDIGFVNNVVDIATILTFIGAGSGYIVTWYDQSLNGNNAGQSTATLQPIFVADGGVDLNNKSVIRLDGNGDFLTFSNFSFSNNNSIYIGCKTSTNLNWSMNQILLLYGTYEQLYVSDYQSKFSFYQTHYGGWFSGNTIVTNNGFFLLEVITNGSSVKQYIDGNLEKDTSASASFSAIGATNYIGARPDVPPSGTLNGEISEIIIYPSAIDNTDRQKIKNSFTYYKP